MRLREGKTACRRVGFIGSQVLNDLDVLTMAANAQTVMAGALPPQSALSQSPSEPAARATLDGRQVSSPLAQFDQYMANVKKTPVMPTDMLIARAREAYRAKYNILQTLSHFPPCAQSIVEQFEHYEQSGFKLSGFIESYGDQSLAAKDALLELNTLHGKGKVEDALGEEDARRRGLKTLSEHCRAFRHAIDNGDAPARAKLKKRISHSFLYFGFRTSEFERLCKIFEDISFEMQRFADLFVAMATKREHLHVLDRLTDHDVQALTKTVPVENRHRFYIEATRLRRRLDDIGLSMRECISLRADYDFCKAEMNRINNRIVESNLLLAARQAIRQNPHDDRLFDACQDANEGLIIAVSRFSYWKGYKFATYACRWIDQRLQRNRQQTVNSDFPVPISIVMRGTKINRVRHKHGEHIGNRPLTAAQVAREVGCTREQVDEVAVAYNAVTNSEEVVAALPCDQTSASSLVEDDERRRIVAEALHLLDDTRREVCRLRWGLGDGMPRSLNEVGAVLGLSIERVRNIETEVLRKLARCSLVGRMRELVFEE